MSKVIHAGSIRRGTMAAVMLLAGLLLRIYFVQRHSFIAGDSLLYQEIAQNWREFHTYGLSTDTVPRPTLIRLPGYPALLALLGIIFDGLLHADPGTLRSFWPVLYLQVFADLGTAALLADLARRLFGARAGIAALALACLCPFLANYTAVPLTETFTVFTTVLACWSAQQWLQRQRLRFVLLTGAALASSMMFRPDQLLLMIAILPLLFRPSVAGGASRWKPLLLCLLVLSLPFAAWTVRNAVTFHVFQPLAPRLANDPGEKVPRGFQRWYRTFGVDFDSTQEFYWKYPEEPVSADNLPRRAFDSQQEEAATRELLQEAAAYNRLRPDLDARFAALAQRRIAHDPMRYYVVLPAMRLANMLLRPRVEMLPVEERWWRFRQHPAQTVFAASYALLGLGYLALGLLGLPGSWKAAPKITASLVGYLLLRCILLLTLDNAEQRYTLEFFPVWILLGSSLWNRHTCRESL